MTDLIERLRGSLYACNAIRGYLDDAGFPAGGDAHGQLAEIEAALTEAADALEAAREDAWQPIETAPKDGTRVMLGNEHGTWIADWRPVYQSGYRPGNPWASTMLNHNHIAPEHRYKRPTHWRNIPAIDQARGKGVE